MKTRLSNWASGLGTFCVGVYICTRMWLRLSGKAKWRRTHTKLPQGGKEEGSLPFFYTH